MSNLKETDYFAARADEEAIRSLKAKDNRVSAAHAEMAEHYRQRAQAARPGRATPLTTAEDSGQDR